MGNALSKSFEEVYPPVAVAPDLSRLGGFTLARRIS